MSRTAGRHASSSRSARRQSGGQSKRQGKAQSQSRPGRHPRVLLESPSPLVPSRTARLEDRQQHARRRSTVVVVLFVVCVVAAVAASTIATVRYVRRPKQAGADPQTTLLLATTAGGQTSSLLLIGVDDTHRKGEVLFVPPQTMTLLPGVGADGVGSALRYGGQPLLTTSVENLLRVRVDVSAVLDDAILGRLVALLGGLDVVIPGRVVERRRDGSRVLAFEHGPTHLTGVQAARFVELVGEGETALDRYPRLQVLWAALLAKAHEDPRHFVSAVVAAAGTGADGLALARVAPALADVAPAAYAYQVLPVKTGVGGSLVTMDDDPAAGILRDGFGASALPGSNSGMRVQVLNGVGRPGVGTLVAGRLVKAGFALPVGGNADHFGYRQTRIVVYSDSETAMALAERVRTALGVGTVEVSDSPQSVVDVTVVVGDDFLALSSK